MKPIKSIITIISLTIFLASPTRKMGGDAKENPPDP